MTAVRCLTLGLLTTLSLTGCAQFQLSEWVPDTEYNPLVYSRESFREDPYESEQITIQRFMNAMDLQQLDAVRLTSTPSFKQEALRHPDSNNDLVLLKIPTGDVEVLEIDQVSDDQKRVKAAIGENKQKLTFLIGFDPDQNEWLVDDIFMKQKKDGVIAVRSVSDQMQLLVTVREFMESAQQGNRENLLAQTSVEFRDLLGDIPEQSFEKLRMKIAGEKPMKSLQPQAQMDETKAIIKIHRLSGQIMMTLVTEDKTWKVDDIAIESREDQYHIPSLRRTAAVMKTALDFVKAYQAQDRQALEAVSDSRFFKYVLKDADLASFPLPLDEMLDQDYRIKASGNIATIVIPVGNDVVTIDLDQGDTFDTEERTTVRHYKVKEVTHFDAANQQQRQLSSVFTSQATLKAFMTALEDRNLDILGRLSTPEFKTLVWNRLDNNSVMTMPIEGIGNGETKLIWSNYQGGLTEFRIMKGEYVVTYQIRDWNGEQLVDDILVSIPNRPQSLKNTLALTIPLHQFTTGVATDDLVKVQKSVSGDFNRLVWKHLSSMPPITKNTMAYYRQQLTKVQIRGKEAELQMGNQHRGALVKLIQEHEQWLIEDIVLQSPETQLQTAELKQMMRMQVAGGTLYGQPLPQSQPLFVDQSQNKAQGIPNGGIQQIGYETPAPVQPVRQPTSSPYYQSPPAELPLDQLPELQVPTPGQSASTVDHQSFTAPAQPIQAFGKLPHQRSKRISPMAPIWKQ